MSNILTAVPGQTAKPGNTGVTGYQLDRQEMHCSPVTGVCVHNVEEFCDNRMKEAGGILEWGYAMHILAMI